VREAAVADQRNADENETAQQLIAHIDEAMQALPEEAQKLLTEHFLLGRSQADIAAQMQVNQSTVSRRMEQAVSELRERLRSEGVTVAAMGVLPMVLEQVREISAPAVVRGALNKIGLSGVTGTSAGAGAVAGAKTISAGAALKLTAAGIVAVAGGALVVHLASRPFKPAAAGAGAAAATQPATRAARAARAERGDRFELDDILDRDEEHDEPDDAGGKK